MKKVIFTLLLIAHMCLIFSFSAQPADLSGEQSNGFTKAVLKMLPFTQDFSEAEMDKIAEDLDFYVRKAAHFSVFALLGILTFLTASAYGIFECERRKKYFAVLLFCLLYALSDEIHQIFVPGRACRVFDIFVDFSGSTAGLLLCIYMPKIFKKEIS